MPEEFIQVITTTGLHDDARQIASALVEQRLAACVQIVGPIESIYRWSGKTETATEWQCQIKTRRDLFERVEQAIRQLHKYDVPEIIALPIIVGSELYLRWLRIETAE